MTESPESSDSAFVSDETSTEHVGFLGAVITIVADADATDATDGALTVTEIDAPPGYENDLHTHRPSELFPVDGRTIPEYNGPSQEDLDRMAVISPRYDVRRIGPLPDP